MSREDKTTRPGDRDPWQWGLLGLVMAISFLSLPALRYDGDVNAWEMEAESLVHRGQLAVRASVAESLPASAAYFVFNPQTGNWYSKYYSRVNTFGTPPLGTRTATNESG